MTRNGQVRQTPRCADTGEDLHYIWVELPDGTALSVEAFYRRFPHLMPSNRDKKPGENYELPLW